MAKKEKLKSASQILTVQFSLKVKERLIGKFSNIILPMLLQMLWELLLLKWEDGEELMVGIGVKEI